jgi:cystathionine beta-lyase/cystathionine gamma-synthase
LAGAPYQAPTAMKKRTRVTHLPDVEVPSDNRALVAPIYQSVKFTFDDVAETERYYQGRRAGFYYSRVSNPTLRQLENALAEMQGRDACLLTASGMAAISATLIALCKQGDHVVYFAEMYQPTRSLIRRVLGRFGVTSSLLSIDDLDGLERVLGERPVRVIVFESPTNPVLKVADIARITGLARRHGALTLLDNTLAGPHSHGELDIDLYVHSLTKYVSGHGDVMGGAIIGRAELIQAMRSDLTVLGPTLDPHAAFLMLRGLRTFFVRRDAQCRGAQRVAEFLRAQPSVERVSYPGLADDPGHDRAARQMEDFGSIVSFDIAGGLAAGNRFAEALTLFAIAASLGSTESLVVAPEMQQPRDLTPEQRLWSAIGPGTVRLSVGIEDPDDLIADLAQALGRSQA